MSTSASTDNCVAMVAAEATCTDGGVRRVHRRGGGVSSVPSNAATGGMATKDARHRAPHPSQRRRSAGLEEPRPNARRALRGRRRRLAPLLTFKECWEAVRRAVRAEGPRRAFNRS